MSNIHVKYFFAQEIFIIFNYGYFLLNNFFQIVCIYSGADLSALVREASEFALKEFIINPISENEIVKQKHFELAFRKIKPSVSLRDCEKYEKMKSMCVNLES